MKKYKIIRIDVDQVGDKIELSLLDGQIETANLTHQKIQKAINDIVKLLNEAPTYKILMRGCDDILIQVEEEEYNRKFLINLMEEFYEQTKFTLSIGIGTDLGEALINLNKAKFKGRNQI